MTAATTTQPRSVPRIGFSATLGAEWTKLWSTRSTWITLGLAIILSIAITAMLSAVVGATIDEWTEPQLAAFDPVLYSFSGTILTAILLAVLGVMFVSSEYSSGMMRLTLTVTPRRGRVLAAKLLVVGIVTLVVGVVATIGMFLVGQAIFASYGLERAALTDADALRAVAGISLTTPVFPVIGAALAFLLRNTAGAITVVLGIIFIPGIFGPLLPQWWQENVLAFLPATTVDAISIGHLDESLIYLELGPAIAASAAWLAFFIAVAYLVLARRDA